MPTLPQTNDKNPAKDRCQTPSYALTPLLRFLPTDKLIWESAAGEGLLVDALELNGYKVVSSELERGQDYFLYQPDQWDIQVTNVPFSKKFKWLERAYRLGKPFAFLVPSNIIFAVTAMRLLDKYGYGMLAPRQRIDYKMPNKGWNSSAQIHTSWLCWGLGVPQGITNVDIPKPSKRRPAQIIQFPDGSRQLAMFA